MDMSEKDVSFVNEFLRLEPSDLVDKALSDLEAVEKDPGMGVNMSVWVMVDEAAAGRCLVCLAGAMLVKTIGINPDATTIGDDMLSILRERFPGITEFALNRLSHSIAALEFFRRGKLTQGADIMEIRVPMEDVDVPNYRDDPEGFKQGMRRVAFELRSRGL